MPTTVEASRPLEARWRAMGSDAHVLVVGGDDTLLLDARARIEELESRWSRFRDDSELSRLNRSAGRPVVCSADLFVAVAAAVDAWATTGGAFDPTVLPALVAAGYDRDFTTGPGPGAGDPQPAPGCRGVVLDATVRAVTLPAGVALDLGGIGKGLAADLVSRMLVERGARGVCVNLGGDLRVQGEAPAAAGWIIGLDHAPDLRIGLAGGAVATSATTRRRWCIGGTERHHLIDPSTGAPRDGDLRAVTVVAGDATRAEVLAKTAFAAGAAGAGAVVERAGATGLLVDRSGGRIGLPGLEAFLR